MNEWANKQLEMLKKVKDNSDALSQTDMNLLTIGIVNCLSLQFCNDSLNYYFTDSR